MIIIACIDNNGGMAFNNRRQSMDSVLREKILSYTQNKKLFMNEYSAKQFDFNSAITVDDDFLKKAENGDYCFIEDTSAEEYFDKIEGIILVHWNRVYPFDLKFNIPLDDFILTEQYEFKGNSHDKITAEVYRR